MATPTAFLGRVEIISFSKKSGKPQGTNPSTKIKFLCLLFSFLVQKRRPRPSEAQMWTWASNNGVWGQEYQSCDSKNDAESLVVTLDGPIYFTSCGP